MIPRTHPRAWKCSAGGIIVIGAQCSSPHQPSFFPFRHNRSLYAIRALYQRSAPVFAFAHFHLHASISHADTRPFPSFALFALFSLRTIGHRPDARRNKLHPEQSQSRFECDSDTKRVDLNRVWSMNLELKFCLGKSVLRSVCALNAQFLVFPIKRIASLTAAKHRLRRSYRGVTLYSLMWSESVRPNASVVYFQ